MGGQGPPVGNLVSHKLNWRFFLVCLFENFLFAFLVSYIAGIALVQISSYSRSLFNAFLICLFIYSQTSIKRPLSGKS